MTVSTTHTTSHSMAQSSGFGKGKGKRVTADSDSSSKRAKTLRSQGGGTEPWVAKDEEDTEGDWEVLPAEVCPIIDKDINPFRLFDLPAEIRVEIYRACLTRPFDILLSRIPGVPMRARLLEESEPDEEEPTENASALSAPLGTASAPQSQLAIAVEASDAGVNLFTGNWRPRANTRDANPRLGPRSSRVIGRTMRSDVASASTISTPPPRGQHGTPIFRSSTVGRAPRPQLTPEITRAPRPQDADPLLVNLLRANKLVYKEARNIMYGENAFCLDLETAQPTLSALHQRSRGQIRNLRLTIPTHNEILERFAEVVRLSLRYCWKLKILYINMPFVLGTDGSSTNTTVYANAFDILRWLPRKCAVVLEGNVCEQIRAVVDKNANLAKSLDELQYARRQLISNESERLPVSDAAN